MKTRLIWCLVVLALAVAPLANADTIIWAATNLSAGASISTTGNNFTGSITFTNGSSFTQIINVFTLQLLNGGSNSIDTLTVTGLPLGWHYYGGKQSNNGTPCDQSGHPDWFCADGFTGTTFVPFEVGGKSSVTVDYSGTFTGTALTTGNLDLMANGCTSTNYSVGVKVDNKGVSHPSVDCATVGTTDGKWAYSDVIGAPPLPVPEPASLALLGGGMTALGHLLRRRK